MALHTILGAGGAISNELVPILQAENVPIRLVSRRGVSCDGAESVTADLTDLAATKKAVKGSSVVYLLVGLKYDIRVWTIQWPKIMDNVITACKEASCKLIFFDNVYMYGPVSSPMTEDLPFQPTSAKGRVRATIARQLLVEMRADRIDALIARSADFYGPHGDKSSVPNMMVFGNMAKGKKAQWLCNAEVPHSYTYIPDAARSLYLLSGKKEAFGETWHVPTAANPLTGREFVAAAASAMGVQNAVTVLPKWMMSLGGLFDRTIKEATEMAYQSELPYLFDSSKFNAAFSFEPTSYEEGIKCAAEKYKASV